MSRTPAQLMLIAVAGVFVRSPSYGQPTLRGLGDLPGGIFRSTAYDVSGDGSIVVGESFSEFGWEAFRWTEETGMVGLGYLPGGGFSSLAYAVSGDGSVIVGQARPSGGLTYEAFRWTEQGGIVGLGYLPGGNFYSGGFEISYDGSVIVGASDKGNFFTHAFRWTAENGMVELGVLPSGLPAHEASGISEDGSVVHGTALLSQVPPEPFRWTEAGGLQSLGFLPGGWSAAANRLTPDGAAGFGEGTSFEGPQMLKWTESEGLVGLGAFMYVLDVTADGSLLVGRLDADGTIWDEYNGLRFLEEALRIECGVDVGDRHLEAAWGISADGSTIVGEGTNANGDDEGWIIRLPTPGSGDYNHDNIVGLTDYAQFLHCFAGPGGGVALCCRFADMDKDGDVDLRDFRQFQIRFTAGE